MGEGNAPASYSGKTFTNSIGMKFVLISPGTFMMESPSNEPGHYRNEQQHKVTLTKGSYMGTTEVTQGQWRKIMGNNPSCFKNCGNNCPVEYVSWDNCQEFIRNLNRKEGTNKYRLPTEAEWEYACRAGTTTPFYTGNCISTDQSNYDCKNPMLGCPKGR
jgi:formylglycine-generating enzyme required for sulfatase activity